MTTLDREPPSSDPQTPPLLEQEQRDVAAPLIALLQEVGGRIELDGEAWFLGEDGRIWRETL